MFDFLVIVESTRRLVQNCRVGGCWLLRILFFKVLLEWWQQLVGVFFRWE